MQHSIGSPATATDVLVERATLDTAARIRTLETQLSTLVGIATGNAAAAITTLIWLVSR